MNPNVCNHCLRRLATAYAPLCMACQFDDDTLLAEYLPAPLPAEPTAYLPGEPAKVRVLADRFQRRERLWHPADARRVA